MARKKKTETTEQEESTFELITEIPEMAEMPEGELDTAGKYDAIPLAPGRVILEELNSGKEIAPFIIVHHLRATQQPAGHYTVRGMLRNGESIKYKLIKKKNQ